MANKYILEQLNHFKFPLKTLEIAFQRPYNKKFSGGACPRTSRRDYRLRRAVIRTPSVKSWTAPETITIALELRPPARQVVCQLKQRQEIIIKPADKGSGTVVMEKTWYIDECNRRLTETNSTDALKKALLPTYKSESPFTLQGAYKDK